MILFISSFEKAVVDAVSLLCRTRLHRSAPFYLIPPREKLVLEVTDLSSGSHGDAATVVVRCGTWGLSTALTLGLVSYNGMWHPWGHFSIDYSASYPVASLSGRKMDTKSIYPMNPDAVHHMQLRIRSRTR